MRRRAFPAGQSVHQALMWVIVRDAKGNRDAPDATTTGEKGRFLIDPVPTMMAGHRVREAIVHARDRLPRSWIRTLPVVAESPCQLLTPRRATWLVLRRQETRHEAEAVIEVVEDSCRKKCHELGECTTSLRSLGKV